MSYLLHLQSRLARGAQQFSPAYKQRQRSFLMSQQHPSGGFCGRRLPEDWWQNAPEEHGPDLYYTAFALRGLLLVDGVTPELAQRVADYLYHHLPSPGHAIDLISWLFSAMVVSWQITSHPLATLPDSWVSDHLQALEQLRAPDGGFARTAGYPHGSTYHSFLITLIYELLGQPLPEPERLIQFLLLQHREDGGFVEVAAMRQSGTNPTAAAVALLNQFQAWTPTLRSSIYQFYGSVLCDDGGFAANTRIPFSDALSTFTSVLTCRDMGWHDLVDQARLARLLSNWELPSGGYGAAAWDQTADAEYTFYGVGLSALLYESSAS
ncbi:MAG: beta-hydroxylase [Planctomycetaceae bacterium]|nr:MAG: beta-hydroxylase [Planctomycetaceae bacterium]